MASSHAATSFKSPELKLNPPSKSRGQAFGVEAVTQPVKSSRVKQRWPTTSWGKSATTL